MGRSLVAAAMAVALAVAPGASAQEEDLAKGIALVDDGDYDAAILVLDGVSRRLAQDPARARDLSQAYVYLGIAYLGKGHEAAAKAKFKEAVTQIKDLTLSPDKFPPKVINAFEAAKSEAASAARASEASPAAAEPAPPAPKKGGSGKLLLIGGGVAVAAGVALAAGGGGDSGGGATSTTQPSETRNRLEFTGRLPNAAGGSYDSYTVVATRPGVLEARVTWTNGQIEVGIGCCGPSGCEPACGGTYTRTSNTSSTYTIPQATQRTYLIQPYNNSGQSDAYNLVVLFP